MIRKKLNNLDPNLASIQDVSDTSQINTILGIFDVIILLNVLNDRQMLQVVHNVFIPGLAVSLAQHYSTWKRQMREWQCVCHHNVIIIDETYISILQQR